MFPAGNEIAGLSPEPPYVGKLQHVVSPLLSRFCYSCRTFAQKCNAFPECASSSFSKEHGVAWPRPGGEPLRAWQLYRLAAGGSRERLGVRQFYGSLYPRDRIDAMGKTLRWVIPGSRLLATDRAAIL